MVAKNLNVFRLVRSGGLPEPGVMVGRAASGASMLVSGGRAVSLFVVRERGVVSGFVCVPGGGRVDEGVQVFASSVGAKAVRVEHGVLPVLVSSGEVGVLRFDGFDDSKAGVVQAGADFSSVAQVLGSSLGEGDWFGVVFRGASKVLGERRAWGRWLDSRQRTDLGRVMLGGSHATRQSVPVVCSFFAGSVRGGVTGALLEGVVSGLPGWDVSVSAVRLGRVGAGLAGLVPVVLGGLVAWWPVLVDQVFGPGSAAGLAGVRFVAYWGGWFSNVVFGLGVGLGLLWWLLLWRGVGVCLRNRVVGWLSGWMFGVPPVKLFKRRGGVRGGVETVVSGRDADYPLARRCFMAAPHQLAALVAPQAGALSGEGVVASRVVPRGLREASGALVGSGEGGVVRLSWPDVGLGVAVVGVPGSGKSVLLQHLWGAECFEKQRPSGASGAPGASNALVGFDVKDESAGEYVDWSRTAGRFCLRVDFACPNGSQIDFFGGLPVGVDKAAFVTDGFAYAFGGEEWTASKEALGMVFAGGLCLSREDVLAVSGLPGCEGVNPDGSFVHFAHVLLGGFGDVAARALFDRLVLRAGVDEGAGRAVARLRPVFDRQPRERAAFFQAPRNKLDVLRGCDWVFKPRVGVEDVVNPGLRVVFPDWSRVVCGFGDVVVMSGATSRGEVLNESAEKILSALAFYSLREAIQRECIGWDRQGRHVSLFVDELSLVAAAGGSQVVGWFRDRGRSFGVRPFFGTQYLEQLEPELARTVMTFPNLFAFKQGAAVLADGLARELSGDGSDFGGPDLLNLPLYEAVLRADVGGRRQPAVPLRVVYFSERKAEYGRVLRTTGGGLE